MEKDTRELIRNQAIELFYKNGFENTTVVDICKASHITKRTFYYHFESKNEILRNITHELGKKAEKELLADIANPSNIEKVWKVMSVYAIGGENYGPNIIKQVYLQSLEYNANEHFPMDTYMYGIVVSLLQGAIDTKEIETKANAEQLAFNLYHTFRSITITWAFEKGSFSLKEAYRASFDTLLK